MQKRKPGRPHKGWKAAARKSSHIRKGHSPWNDPDHHRASDDGMPDHGAGVPSNANEVLHGGGPWSAAMTGTIPSWDETTREAPAPEGIGYRATDEFPGLQYTEKSQINSDRSTIVAEMKAQRAAPKGPFAPSPYTKESEDAAKMRERLTECFTLLAKAIEKAAAVIVAGREVPEPEVPVERPDSTWNAVGKGTPLNAWLETKYVSMTMFGIKHRFANICMCRIPAIGDEPEWVEKKTGHTTVTNPDSVQAPTHWRWPVS